MSFVPTLLLLASSSSSLLLLHSSRHSQTLGSLESSLNEELGSVPEPLNEQPSTKIPCRWMVDVMNDGVVAEVADKQQNDPVAPSSLSNSLVIPPSLPAWHSVIRRAAGGKDNTCQQLEHLIATFGLTAADLDAMVDSDDGKSALHMAAWKGSMSNIQYLVELGCCINNIARGKYSYGKTPIFFAVTQGRDDVVLWLLDHGAHVKLVNNKGQSVLSLASSHLLPTTIQRIQQAEQEQADFEWINYRLTHSDGAVYGDLDPRFVQDHDQRDHGHSERSSSEYVIKTELAINPTTPQSRRGAFARRNPQLVYQEKIRQEQQKQQQRRQKRKTKVECDDPALQQLRQEQEEVWQRLTTTLSTTTATTTTTKGERDDVMSTVGHLLLLLVRLYMTERRAWIPEVTNRLNLLDVPTDVIDLALSQVNHQVASGLEDATCTSRELMLLQKIVRGDPQITRRKQATTTVTDADYFSPKLPKNDAMKTGWHVGNYHKLPLESRRRLWNQVSLSVVGLSPTVLENPEKNSQHLSLPHPPMWVDTSQQLQLLQKQLHDVYDDHEKSSGCIAFDTEWSHSQDDESQTLVATLQLAIHSRNNIDERSILTWIIDLQAPELRSEAVAFLEWLLHESSVPLLGFAVGRDLRKLEEYIARNGQASNGATAEKIVLDLQLLCAENMSTTSQQPGLQACCQRFVSAWYSLNKKEQCSDWSRRPLTNSQLDYAGLDAAVLLVLLAQLSGSLPPEE